MSETAWTVEHLALVAADLGAWTWDLVTDRVSWSDRVYEIFGVRRDGFGGRYSRCSSSSAWT